MYSCSDTEILLMSGPAMMLPTSASLLLALQHHTKRRRRIYSNTSSAVARRRVRVPVFPRTTRSEHRRPLPPHQARRLLARWWHATPSSAAARPSPPPAAPCAAWATELAKRLISLVWSGRRLAPVSTRFRNISPPLICQVKLGSALCSFKCRCSDKPMSVGRQQSRGT